MNTSAKSHPSGTSTVHRWLTAAGAALLVVALVPSASLAAVGSAAQGPVSAAAVLPQAAAVGKLAPAGCTGSAGSVTCDLYAMTGTTQLPGTAPVPIWGFSTDGTPGSATAPGPVLVVHQDDTVTITLHNGLAQPVSLALPGQPAGQISTGLNDTTGAAASGGTSTYTFKASRPGTFLYEAGHTPDGARQVAMGLAGALVVLATDGTAAGQAFDDESVMVLSEIDPALNAHPDTFDMRNFHPGWRLINGRPFPSTSEIPTDQGHTVLLRYVNVGSMTHPMSLLGADQQLLAEDGHALSQPRRETVADVAAGATADTLVKMPTGPETRVTLFEEGSHLDNVGQTEPGATKVAPGGMMTFLNTNAPPLTSDIVGPAASHVSVTPSPSDGLTDVTVAADLSDLRSGGSNIAAAEFVVDDDAETAVAVGFGTKMTGSFGSPTAHVTGTIPAHLAPSTSCTDVPTPVVLECLPAGKHHIYVRGQDSASSSNWGVVSSVVLNLPKTGPATTGGSVAPTITNGSKPLTFSATGDDSAAEGNIDKAEYFVDPVDPVHVVNGTGTLMTSNPPNRVATVVSEDGQLPVTPPAGQMCTSNPLSALSCLTEGIHHVVVHSHDTLGLWGPTLDLPFTVDKTGPTVEGASIAPPQSNGLVSAKGYAGNLVVSASIADKTSGGAEQSPLAGAEGFFKTQGADGNGFGLLAVDGTFDTPTEAVYGLIPLSQVRTLSDGKVQVFVHGRDMAGNWGPTFAVDLTVDKTAPVLGSTVTASPNPPPNGAALLTLSAALTEANTLGAAEFWTGTTDPGAGKATSVPVSLVSGGRAQATIPLAGLPAGATRFNLRVQDQAGNWSNAVNTTVTVTVTQPNAIFSDSFTSGNLNSWSVRTNTGTGTMSASGTNALTVFGPGTHYVTDNTPTAETGYHASFTLTPNTLTSTGTTVFDTRTANNGGGNQVFAVAFRKNAGANQVRLSMGAANGAWVPLPAGSPTIRVDWVAGPATGAARGTTKLSLNGTAVTTLTGNSNTLRVESARLGLVTTGATKTGSFDDFVSTRNTLP